MNKKAGAQTQRNYQIRPPFKDKFRPSEAKEMIEKIVEERLKNQVYLTD